MALELQSTAELFTTLSGWQFYDDFWTLLSQTGIAFLPFIGIILRNMAKPYESQEAKDAGSTSLRRMEVDIVATIVLILLGVAPMIPINAQVVSYAPVCTGDTNTTKYTPGNTDTTWDGAFTIPGEDVHVPLWWYAVISVSEGITAAAKSTLTCEPDLRGMVAQVNTTEITDPELKQELMQFEQQCYIPAKAQYLHDTQNSNNQTLATVDNDLKTYGADDTEWVGSHAYQDTYYKNLRASQPVKNFAYNANDDINADSDKNNPPPYASPTCADWWNGTDGNNGLKSRIHNTLPGTFWSAYNEVENHENPLTDQTEDHILRQMLEANGTGVQEANSTVGDYGYSHVATAIGVWWSQLTNYPKLYVAQQATPIIQALILFLVYVFLPFALVFTSYRPKAFITGAIIIFSLIFWSFIFGLVTYLDHALIKALYGPDWIGQQSPDATLADMIICLLIIVAPLFWFSFMGAIGVAVGEFVSGAFSQMNSIGDKAAQEGVQIAKKAAGTVASKITKVL